MRTILLTLAFVSALGLAACGGSDDSPSTPLADARTVTASTTAAAVTQASKSALALGQPGKLDNVELTISKATRATPANLAGRKPTAPEVNWLIIELTAKNPSADKTTLPNLELACANGVKANRYVDDDPTAIKAPDLPAKSQLSGRFLFGLPDGCTPATLTAKPVVQIDGKPTPIAWSIP